jgi:hypothetical protein
VGLDNHPIYALGNAHNNLFRFTLPILSFALSSSQSSVLEKEDQKIGGNNHGIFSTTLKYFNFS